MKSESFKISAIAAAVILLGFVVAYQFVPPPPPDTLRIATGRETGAYYAAAVEYRKLLAERKVTVEIQPTAGSIAALKLLAAGEVDVGFVQGGTAKAAPTAGLGSLASVFYEPLWGFHRKEVPARYLFDLRGKRVAVGEQGSGTRPLALRLLADNRVDAQNTELLELSSAAASEQLRAGRIDAAFFVVSPKAAMVGELLAHPEVELMSFRRARAYGSRYPYLTNVSVGEGMVDLERNIPPADKTLLAATASLVAGEGVHPYLARLLLAEATKVHGDAGVLEQKGQFPSARFVELPLDSAAERFLKDGPNWLERVFPYWLASALARLKIMLLPLLALMLPVIKSALPVYRFRIRFQIFRWYRVLREVDRSLHELKLESIGAEIERLRRLQQELAEQVSVPLSFMGEFYDLRMHVRMILARLSEQRQKLIAARSPKKPRVVAR